MQVPLAEAPSAAAHTSHPPLHALLQQKPSTQFPDVHWALLVQACPVGSVGVQALFKQALPDLHSALPVHEVGQLACPPQR